MKWTNSKIDLTHGTPRLRSKTQVEYVFSKMTTLRFFKYQKRIYLKSVCLIARKDEVNASHIAGIIRLAWRLKICGCGETLHIS